MSNYRFITSYLDNHFSVSSVFIYLIFFLPVFISISSNSIRFFFGLSSVAKNLIISNWFIGLIPVILDDTLNVAVLPVTRLYKVILGVYVVSKSVTIHRFLGSVSSVILQLPVYSIWAIILSLIDIWLFSNLDSRCLHNLTVSTPLYNLFVSLSEKSLIIDNISVSSFSLLNCFSLCQKGGESLVFRLSLLCLFGFFPTGGQRFF
jgi:hypothetical protein